MYSVKNSVKNSWTRLACVVVCLGLVSAGLGGAQQVPPVAEEDGVGPMVVVSAKTLPQTKLEKLLERRGAVVVTGFTEVGTANGEDGSVLRVLSIEVKAEEEREIGIALEITRGGGRTVVAYIDSDEAATVLGAMREMSRLERSVTSLARFDATFRSRGGLQLVSRDRDGARMMLVKCEQVSDVGQVIRGMVPFRPNAFSTVLQQFESGVQSLERLAK